MKLIKLNKIIRDGSAARPDPCADTDEINENSGAALPPQEAVTAPMFVNVECIRCFYPRRNDRPGTRITFSDGGGQIVAETYDQVANEVLTAIRL